MHMDFQKPKNDDITALDAALAENFRTHFSVEPFLSRKIVSFQGNKDKPAYGWYKYKEAFSAELVKHLLNGDAISSRDASATAHAGIVNRHQCTGDASKRFAPIRKILDPFAGIGTTLFAASELGIAADGIELLPIGQEIINARLILERDKRADTIFSTLERWITHRPWNDSSKRVPFSTLRITENAYPAETADAIERYRGAMLQESEEVQAVLRLALLCILESISYTRKDGQCLRWDTRSGKTRANTKPFNKGQILGFDAAITAKLKEILSDVHPAPTLFSNPRDHETPTPPVGLFKGSCLEILPTLSAETYDAVLTSPPYCNRYDYTRTYALELAMLELTHEDVTHLRQQMLSCTVENRQKDLQQLAPQWAPFLTAANRQPLLQAILTYLDTQKSAGALNNSGIPRMVRGYFYEMACVIGECARVLKPNARLFMVNDNVRYAGVSISVDMILSDIARSLGFAVEKILVVPEKKGNSSQQMGVYGRVPLRKCVTVWRRCG